MRVWMMGPVLMLAACGQSGGSGGSGEAPMADQLDVGSPDINPSAAPGVAWRYDTSFRLEDERIGAVQEVHAAACEAMGPTRCRITGLSYTAGEDDLVEGRLEVKLAPTLARQFGKDAAAAVQRADGRLIATEFIGEDVGGTIASAGDDRRSAADRLADVEGQLARSDLEDAERATLRQSAAALRDRIEGARQEVRVASAELASTPMTLRYYGDGGVPGFTENPFHAAWMLFVQSVILLVSLVLKVLAVLIPFGLLAAALIALWRTPPAVAARRWVANRGHTRTAELE